MSAFFFGLGVFLILTSGFSLAFALTPTGGMGRDNVLAATSAVWLVIGISLALASLAGRALT